MNTRKILLTMIFGTFVAHHLIAQKVFNEMQYAKDKTAFTLNAPQTVTLRIYCLLYTSPSPRDP